jgi:predicted MFS family arabinose efflux permease
VGRCHPLLAYQLTGSAVMAALAETFHLVGLAGALLPAGVLADRFDRRRLMRLSSASGVLLYASLVAALLAGVLTTPYLFVVALFTGAGAAVFAPAEISAVRSVVSTEELATALSQHQARQHVASLVGAPVGGALYAVSRSLPFLVDALTYAVTWVMLGRVRADLSAPVRTGPRKRPRQEVAEGLSFIRHHPFLRVLTVWAALSNLIVNALFFAAVLRLVQGGFHPMQIGIVETAAGVFGVLGSLAAPMIIDRFATGWLTIAASWSFVPLVVPMVFFNNPAVVALALGAGLFLNPAGNAGIGAYRLAITPLALQGRTVSTMQFVAMVAMPLAPVLAGGLLGGLGGAQAVAVLGALAAGVALIPTFSTSIRSVPRPAVWRAEQSVAEPVAA